MQMPLAACYDTGCPELLDVCCGVVHRSLYAAVGAELRFGTANSGEGWKNGSRMRCKDIWSGR